MSQRLPNEADAVLSAAFNGDELAKRRIGMTLVEAGFQPREHTYDLESIKGGWVKLRRMNHGESNELSGLRVAFQIKGENEDEDAAASARTTIKLSRHFSFNKVIIDHNLGHNGKALNFSKRRDVDDLDAVIGDEIATLIDKHNETLEVDNDGDGGDTPNSQSN